MRTLAQADVRKMFASGNMGRARQTVFNKRVGLRIYDLIDAQDWGTLDEVADRVGMSRSALTDVLAGRASPRLWTVKLIAEALGISLVKLLEGVG